jgi:hypothetical protein
MMPTDASWPQDLLVLRSLASPLFFCERRAMQRLQAKAEEE